MRFGSSVIAGALALIGLLALAGCGGAIRTEATPVVTRGATAPAAAATVTASATRRASGAPTAAPTASLPQGTKAPLAAATPTRPAVATAFVLKVFDPADESVVNRALLVVRGQTAVGAVVSVNATLATVDATGAFSAPITLEEGANLIEVVASDYAGNVLTQEILVVFEP